MNAALTTNHNDAAFYRNRKAMLVYPLIIFPFLIALFWLFGGGKGERYLAEEAAANKAGSGGFNASVPTAKNGSINGRDVDAPGYGKAQVGQVLSSFTNTRQDSINQGLKAIPVSNNSLTSGTTTHASSLASTPLISVPSKPARSTYQPTTTAAGAVRTKAGKGYYYNPPGSASSNTALATDRQLDQQLQQYETTRNAPLPIARTYQATPANTNGAKPSTVQLSDNLTASRLAEPVEADNPFLTAPTGGSRTQPSQAVLTGGNYGAKKVITWMIPVVVHEDQAVQDGQQVKLRLLKEITVDGVTVPANTILYALCQLSNDRLRLTVQNLQLNGQLIPMDLDVYDTDGSMGVNVPGTSRQVGGQIQSSAVQGVQLPGLGGLVNTVANQARMSASTSLRQTTIRLRAGYNLFLKAQ